jgi:phenylalanyl-tRNA synthetase alpha chain
MTEDVGTADDLGEALEALHADTESRLGSAATVDEVEQLRAEVLGRSGRLTLLLRQLPRIEPSQRPAAGAVGNRVRGALETGLQARLAQLQEEALTRRLMDERLDMTGPGRPVPAGGLHPLLLVERDMREIFHSFGFEVFEGPEVETDEYNFELLNIAPDHPARDLWDTLYVAEAGGGGPGGRPADDGTILRTHTSPVQIRAMRALEAPIRIIMPGRCFRHEAVDAGHNFEFFQMEGLVVDHDSSLADLKGMLEMLATALYGPGTKTRFRPGYYPFTEPSVAFDVGCMVCHGAGCPACKRSGWMTILGAGMVHPTVLSNGGFDPDRYQGYAFGMGLDRMTMLRYGIPDVRLLMGADLRFLEQFAGGR